MTESRLVRLLEGKRTKEEYEVYRLQLQASSRKQLEDFIKTNLRTPSGELRQGIVTRRYSD